MNYKHLYSVPYLRTSAVADGAGSDASTSGQELDQVWIFRPAGEAAPWQ